MESSHRLIAFNESWTNVEITCSQIFVMTFNISCSFFCQIIKIILNNNLEIIIIIIIIIIRRTDMFYFMPEI